MLAALLATVLAYSAVSPRGAVAAAHPLASEVGAAVLRQGGNAVDAAVATALALSVVEPESSGLGGGGFALVYTASDKKVRVIDFREVAPAASRPGMFLRGGKPDPDLSRQGGLAVAVPGAAMGYAELARRFGSLPLSRLAEPAARLAERGFQVSRKTATLAALRLECLRADAAAAAEILPPPAAPGGPRPARAPGTRLARRDLAATLRLLGRDPEAFYRGNLAARIAAAAAARGGVLTARDLASYRVREREPLWGRYRGHRIASLPPPSAGGAILIGLLQALEPEDPRAGGYRPERFLHAFVEVEKRLFARRAADLGDPGFVSGAAAAAAEMVSPAYAAALHAAVSEQATPAEVLGPGAGAGKLDGNTTHLSAVDAKGNAVAMTTSVNGPFGACLAVPGTGILLNDTMDDFSAAPGSANQFDLVEAGANAVAPGKIPLSSMAPTLVFDAEGRLELAVGSPGGSAIPGVVAQVIVHLVDDGMPLAQALSTPRILHQWRPDVILSDNFGLEAATARALEARGHRIQERPLLLGNPQAVRVDPASGLREAAGEGRWDGLPASQ